MRITFELLPTLVFVVVVICWFVFAGVFLLRRQPASPPDERRSRGSLIGVAVQGLSYATAWGIRRPAFTPIALRTRPFPIYTAMLGMLVATGLAVSHWIALFAALIVFFIGTIVRVRSE
jgi:hypothetical protein